MPAKGQKQTQEFKDMMSRVHKGKIVSSETRKRLSESLKVASN